MKTFDSIRYRIAQRIRRIENIEYIEDAPKRILVLFSILYIDKVILLGINDAKKQFLELTKEAQEYIQMSSMDLWKYLYSIEKQ